MRFGDAKRTDWRAVGTEKRGFARRLFGFLQSCCSEIFRALHSGELEAVGTPVAKIYAPTCLLFAAWLLLSGCVATFAQYRYDNPPAPKSHNPELLTGAIVFGETVRSDEVPAVDVLARDEAMDRFVEDYVMDRQVSAARLKRLMRRLREEGYFDGSYDAYKTQTALETFHSRRGNCLSYTNLFIALARAAGLQANYQIVAVPPTWNADSGMLIRNNHINVRLTGARYNHMHSDEYTVDFNALTSTEEYSRWRVSDTYAQSLYYANVSVEHVRLGQHRLGFVYLLKAIELVPGNPDLWINLGAFYSRHEELEPAVEAFHVALELDPNNKAAISGLARGYRYLGRLELAEGYERKVRKYRLKNAYYHFAVAQSAFEEAKYDESLAAIDRAIGIKRRDSRFHFLKGLAEQKLGDEEAAHKSFARARRYGSIEEKRRRNGSGYAVTG